MIWIALLLGSVTDPLFAQLGEINYALDAKLNAPAFKKDYPNFLAPASFEIQLSKGNRLLLLSQKYSSSRLVQKPDSLIRLFWNDYSRVIDQLPEDTDGVSVQYLLEENQEPQLRWKSYPQSTIEYAVMNEELVRVKSVQDTLRITVQKADNRQAEAYLLVNDLKEIPRLFDEIREKTAYLIEHLEKRTAPLVLERSPEVYGRYLGDRNIQLANFGSDMLILSPSASLGYIRGNWMTTLNAEFTLFLEKAYLKPLVGYQQHYFFNRLPEGEVKIHQNGFVLAGLSFFKKSQRTTSENREIKHTGQLTLGYLVHRRGSYYEANTWRLSGGIHLTPFFKIEPEVYFNNAFKNLSPGLRFTIGL